jgi:hypothetical protein
MADVSANGQSNGSVVNIASGGFTADGTATNVTCGFVPRVVEFHNATDRISQLWTADMAATQTLQTIATGVRTLETGSLIVATTDADTFDGFIVAAGAAVNTKACVWVAYD